MFLNYKSYTILTLLTLLVSFGLFSQSLQAKGSTLYVCNQGEATIDLIDMETLEISSSVDLQALGFSENAKPHHTLASKDGEHWFVSLIGENKILKFNQNNELVGSADFIAPGMLAIDNERQNLFVGRSMSAVNPPHSIGMIQRDTMLLEDVGTFFPRPHALIFDSTKERLFSASLSSNQLMFFQPSLFDKEIYRFKGPTQTYVQFALNRDATLMIATGQLTGMLSVFDVENPSRIQELQKIKLGKMPWHPVIHPNQPIAYIPLKGENAIAIANLETGKVEKLDSGDLNLFSKPHGSALSNDGSLLFISNNHDRKEPSFITVVDTEKKKVIKKIKTGVYSTGIGTEGGQISLLDKK